MNESANSSAISTFLANSVASRGDQPAFGFIRNGELQWRTWQDVADAAAQLAEEIRAAGIAPGDCIAHVAENRYEWVITDLAIHLVSAVHVPIHVTLSGEQIAEQIIDCGAQLALVSTADLAAKFVGRLDPHIKIWLHENRPIAASQTPGRAGGSRVVGEVPSPQSPASGALATILYTSGTTGRPRGVMLSHRNLATNAATLADSFGDMQNETRLCVLPLSHIYARTCDLYTWVYRGSKLVLAESRDTLVRDLQVVQPTALNAVPYIYQRIADHIRAAGRDEGAALSKFFGGRIELLNCGGAPLAPEIEAWYAERDLPVLIGYGLTETSPVVAASTPAWHRAGAVGRPLRNVEVRIADDGEVLVRGPNIMLGYWRDEAATADVIRDGWFRTGDLGALDADGFLSIRGRKKELIVLSTGKKVTPTRVELLLTTSAMIEQAAVFGDGLCGLVALIVPAAASGLAGNLTSSQSHAAYEQEIKRCLVAAAHEEQIHRYVLLDRPFSIDRGEMTGKLSLCRAVIARNFAMELQGLASQSQSSR